MDAWITLAPAPTQDTGPTQTHDALEKENVRLLDENRRLANNNEILNYQLRKMALERGRLKL